MKKTILCLFFALIGMSNVTFAQDKDQMLADWQRAKEYTKEYLDAMPEDGYGFKPSPEMRSFAEQMLHLTDANFGFASAASGIKSPIERGAAEKSADKSKAATVKLVMESYDFVISAITAIKPEDLSGKVPFFRGEMARGLIINKCFEHQTHHRGQTTVYIRLKGAKPPQEKLF
ncbi:hypothetical protein EMA8858_00054 [Emticicia aquatica]|jgi:uncharacterized damage-inducible protein DinB|uniref:DinB-like domain-containing protein n=1 Tax=Emticicia aquatica TaxID=1681835 RepID=A0ABM9AJQ1_9BACT|nr:DinB family protein [Emticicia aquatica]CAH0993949.1 hypothetical protein EMA8858_00054 [Emticicia aquatica]